MDGKFFPKNCGANFGKLNSYSRKPVDNIIHTRLCFDSNFTVYGEITTH